MKKIKYFLILLASILLVTYLFFTSEKKAPPNILVFSIENLHFSSPLKSDSMFLALSAFASENHLSLVTKKDKAPVFWIKQIGAIPKSNWDERFKQVGFGMDLLNYRNEGSLKNREYLIEVPNDSKSIPYANILIKKRFSEKNISPFFLLINIHYLTPPLYDADLFDLYDSSPSAPNLLDEYTLNPQMFRNKSFIFSILFDNYRYFRPTSFQSAMISPDIGNRDFTFWQNAYGEFSKDSSGLEDLKLIDELYTKKLDITAKSIIELLNDLKNKGLLQNTLIFLTNSSNTENPKDKFYNQFFSKDLKKEQEIIIISSKKIISQTKLTADNKEAPEKMLLKLIEGR